MSAENARRAYIGVDGQVYLAFEKPVEIRINRVEGPVSLCDRAEVARSYGEAVAILQRHAGTAPDDGSYDKVDFEIRFADGASYSGRFDLTRRGHPDLAAQARGVLAWMQENPGLSGVQSADQARRMLEHYDFEQGPVPVPLGEPVNLVADYRLDRRHG